MPVVYPKQILGQFGLEMGLTYALLNQNYGFDFGEHYHLNIEARLRQNMEIDRVVFDNYGDIGLGFETPFPRVSIAPFGHLFIPAVYGCPCHYAKDSEPCAKSGYRSDLEIKSLPAWTAKQLEKAEPVQIVLSQLSYLKEHYNSWLSKPQKNTTPPIPNGVPHFRQMSSQQNLGSVINNAFTIRGQQLFIDYISNPGLVQKLYENITDLMLCCMDRFQQADGWALPEVFVGNCTVAMISPEQYARMNYPYDRRLMDYAQSNDSRFMVHQDSDTNAHLENYAKFDYLHFLDIGQDTDFEKVARLFPDVDVNCILFPSWIQSHPIQDIQEQLLRLMQLGKSFRSFSFSLWEIDSELGGDKIFTFYDTFRKCAETTSFY